MPKSFYEAVLRAGYVAAVTHINAVAARNPGVTRTARPALVAHEGESCE